MTFRTRWEHFEGCEAGVFFSDGRIISRTLENDK